MKQYDPLIAARKQRNADIFKETTDIIREGGYRAPSGKIVELTTIQTMVDWSTCYHSEIEKWNGPELPEATTVMVEPNDCLVAAQRLVKAGYRPALLNFASAGHPGGGVETGARAQEETICRRSTLSRSIFAFDASFAKRFGYQHRDGNNYPLSNLDFSLIYSPEVTVFREGLECTLMEEPYQVDVITCAALNLGGRYELKLTPDGKMPDAAKRITRNKIRSIFRVALFRGNDSLVLGAFGCGAFKNPPEEVASIFKEVLEDPEFRNRFRLVTFSIIEDHNSNNANLNAFKKVLGNIQTKMNPAPAPANGSVVPQHYQVIDGNIVFKAGDEALVVKEIQNLIDKEVKAGYVLKRGNNFDFLVSIDSDDMRKPYEERNLPPLKLTVSIPAIDVDVVYSAEHPTLVCVNGEFVHYWDFDISSTTYEKSFDAARLHYDNLGESFPSDYKTYEELIIDAICGKH